MRKFAAATAVVVLVAFAAPVFAATNPFMDVPMNHWAYDAIGQLAAHGILSGYPDGTYKGKQPTTRYEMASALARALAVVDMTKASKQDVEMMKKLIVEFRDELEALGVKVADLDDRVKVLEDRLGGWKLSGHLRLEITQTDDRPDLTSEGNVNLSRARVIFEKWFGEDESIHFKGILRGDSGNGFGANGENWHTFMVEVPFFMDSTLTVGKFWWDMESAYYLGGDFAMPETGSYVGRDSVLTDRGLDALGWSKQFGLGSIHAYVAHPAEVVEFDSPKADDPDATSFGGVWELFAMAQLQFTEQIGFDIGGQVLLGDNIYYWDNATATTPATAGYDFDNIWTVFAGLRFNFNESVAFKAIYYHQKWNADRFNGTDWIDDHNDAANHWRAIVHVDQELLKFTSLWLEYGQVDTGFFSSHVQGDWLYASRDGREMPDDLKYWRVALGQEWNEKWATHLFYFNYDFDGMTEDLKEWGLGVQYKYNPNVKFGLNYLKVDNDTRADDYRIRVRTDITF